MRCLWFAVFLLIPFSTVSGQQQERQVLALSLRRAVELALARGNAQIELSREGLEQARTRSDQARAALLPNLESSLIYRNQTVNLAANGIRFDIPTAPGQDFVFPRLVGPFSVLDARVSGSQSIFDFSSIRRFQAARTGVTAAESDLAGTEERIAADVARAYLQAIRADADVESAEANVTLAEAVLGRRNIRNGPGRNRHRNHACEGAAGERLPEAAGCRNARRRAHLQLCA